MTDDKKNSRADDAALLGRPFELSEALGRENAGALRGGSPVPRTRQVLAEIEHYLEMRLHDPEGSLHRTILSRLKENAPLLGRHHDQPLDALAEFLARVLGSDSALESLVRETDARWGREYQERPYFESDDGPAQPDDPYQRVQVRRWLRSLARSLASRE